MVFVFQFNELIKELDENGNIETAHILKLNKKLNVQNSYHQKQIEDLVKAANKLQHSLDGFERENLVLRYVLVRYEYFRAIQFFVSATF